MTQIYGLTLPAAGSWAPRWASAGAHATAALSLSARDPVPAAQSLLDAAAAGPVGRPAVYVPEPAEDGLAAAAQGGQWFLALTASWTQAANDPVGLLGVRVDDPVAVALTVLGSDPQIDVVVAPQSLDQVSAAAAEHGWAERVRSW